jgi:hypothetical protein
VSFPDDPPELTPRAATALLRLLLLAQEHMNTPRTQDPVVDCNPESR